MKETTLREPTRPELDAEEDRLFAEGLGDLGYGPSELSRLARLTWKINALKRRQDAVIPAHVYQRAVFLDHGNVTSTAQAYLDAAGLSPDKVYVAGFDLSPVTVDAVKSGYVDLVIDQQQWLQGFEAITQICLTHNYGFSGLFINTGGGFVDATNIDVIAPLVEQQIR